MICKGKGVDVISLTADLTNSNYPHHRNGGSLVDNFDIAEASLYSLVSGFEVRLLFFTDCERVDPMHHITISLTSA